MAIKAELTSRDRRFLDMSLNAPMWKVILYIGTPLALYQGLAAIFTILDTLMASHAVWRSVRAFRSAAPTGKATFCWCGSG